MTLWLVTFSLSLYYVEKLPGPGALVSSAGGAAPQTGVLGPTAAPIVAEGPVCDPATRAAMASAPKVYAYLPNAPDWASLSLGRSCGMIDVLLPEWYGISDLKAGIVPLAPDAGDTKALLAKLPAGDAPAHILPVLTLAFGDLRTTKAGGLANPQTRTRLADAAAKIVADNGYSGLCIGTTDLLDEDLPGFKDLFVQVAARLAARDQQACVIVAADGPLWRDAQILAAADKVVFLAFKTPADASLPGPLAAQAWFERVVAEAVATVGADRLVVALGSFGHDWVAGGPAPEPIGFAEAMRRAALHAGQITLSQDALNTTIQWVDDGGLHHDIWLLDAVSLRNQRAVLEGYAIGGVAIWPLGSEDPQSWAALALGPLDPMETLSLPDYVGYEGKGPFMRVLHPAETGHRDLTLDTASGLIQSQSYQIIPQPFSIARFGAGTDNMIALTFDDGPDIATTPAILDVLKAQSVPATFFLIGSNILQSPDVVRRMVAEGHEVGSHTFFHPDIERIGDLRKTLELNTLQRLVISVTGHSTVLFRTPYGRGLGPLTAAEALPFVALDQRGYLVVGANVVPPDWQDVAPADIVAAALAQLAPSGGNVIVLHDAGGDRSATVAALPTLITALREKGYRFVSLAQMLGVPREALMPTETGARVT
ncbi:MAG: polysaccharide deacetylase family protein, partial [Paracoccaceae bacterium]